MTKTRVKMFLLAGLGTGWLPKAPGTWASAAAALLWLTAALALDGNRIVLNALTLVGAAAATAVCIAFSRLAIAATGDDDPGMVTADEFAGQWLALVGVGSWFDPLLAAAVQFVLFRLFDIIKPWPCRRLEALPGGVGIAADDLMAGLYAILTGWLLQALFIFVCIVQLARHGQMD